MLVTMIKKPEKNQGFNGIRTRDLRDTGAMLYQLSYEATHWERLLKPHIGSMGPLFGYERFLSRIAQPRNFTQDEKDDHDDAIVHINLA